MEKFVKYFFTLLFVFAFNSAFAQFEDFEQSDTIYRPKKTYDPEQEKLIDKITFGGDLGLGFGNYSYVGISLSAGYNVTEWFMPGIIGIYNHNSYENLGIDQTIYGVGVFTQFFPLKSLALHMEGQYLDFDDFSVNRPYYNFDVPRTNDLALLVGAGYRVKIPGRRIGMTMLMLFNVNNTKKLEWVYENPLIRFQLNF